MKRVVQIAGLTLLTLTIGAGVAFSVWNRPNTTNPFEQVAKATHTPASENPAISAEPARKQATDADAPPGDVLKMVVSSELVDGFPASVEVLDGDRSYTVEYTGQFTRQTKLLFLSIDLYTIASYIESPKPGETEQLLDDMLVDGVRRVYLLRMCKNIPSGAIAHAMDLEIDNYFTDVDLDRLSEQVNAFRAVFSSGARRNQIVYMAWLPGGRVYASFNNPNDVKMIAQDLPLAKAVWAIWAAPHSGPERVGLVEKIATASPAAPPTRAN